MKASLIKPSSLLFILLPFLVSAQQVCEPNYSVPYLVSTYAHAEAGKMSNSQYNLMLTTGYPVNTTADNITVNSAVMGFWGNYLKEPRPPIVRASDGDFQNAVLVQWTVEGDRTGPPVTGNEVQLYRNGYILTTLPVSQTQYQDLNVFPGTYYTYGATSSNSMGTSHTDDDVGFLNPNGVITGHVETPSGNPVAETKVTLTPNVGRSAFFDGASYIYFFDETTSANRHFTGLSGDYTIETWFRSLDSLQQQTIFAAVDSATSNHYVRLELTAAGKVRWLHSTGSDSAMITTVNPYAGAGSAWHHLAAVFSNNAMTLYIDGAIVGNTTAAGPVNDNAEIIIGKRSPYDHNRYFRGRLDDFRIWSTAREWEDLRKFMDLTLSGTEPGLAGYWKFDEMEGSILFDLTANDIDGNICGIDHDYLTAPVYVGAISESTGNYAIRSVAFGDGTTFTVTPRKTTPVGRSLRFDGSDDYVSFPNRRIDLTGGYTVEGWFKTGAAADEKTVIAGVNPAGGTPRMRVDVTGAGYLKFSHFNTSITSTSGFNDELWHHYAAVFDTSNLRIKLYADGDLVDSAAVADTIPDPTEIVIARRAPAVASNYFNGFLDEMRVWNTARNQAQVGGTLNQTLEGDEYGLAHYWRLNEGAGTIVADATGHQVTGTIQGNAAWTQDIPLNEVFVHYYEPESRQASLNNSNTSVDLVDFTDISMIAISGFVNYAGSTCFQEGVEILVNNQSLTPRVLTDANGKYILELEPGRSGDVISASYRDHQFTPDLIELPLISTPLTGLSFTDLTDRDLEVTVAGGVEKFPISPPVGDIIITIRAISGCVVKQDTLDPGQKTLTFPGLPPLIYQVTVDHPNPAIDLFFTGDTVSLEDTDRSIEFIYRSEPEVSLSGLPVDTCGNTVLNMYGKYPVTYEVFETYISYNVAGPDTNLSHPDSGTLTITNSISDLAQITLPFTDGVAQDTIIGGIPNILSGGSFPYQKNLTVSATDNLGRNTATVVIWAYVTGHKPRNDGNYFATTTPEMPLMILRAPPGDGSTLTIEQGTTMEQSMGFSMIQDESASDFTKVHLGADFEMEIGFIVSTTISVDVTLDFSSEMSVGVSQSSETEQTWTWTVTETFSTTPNAGDVYVGGAMNIVYGITDVLEMTPACTVRVAPDIIMTPGGFATTYIYSQHYIESLLIPGLLTIGDTSSARSWTNIIARNDTLKKWAAILATNPDTLYSMNPVDVAALATEFFSGATNLVPENLQNFPEPEPEDADYDDPQNDLPFGDYFNQLMAAGISLDPTMDAPPPTGDGFNRNVSFDAGVVYSYSLTTGMAKTEKVNYEMTIAEEVATAVGVTVNGIGVEGGYAVATQNTRGKSESVTETRTQTVSFTLADDDAGTGDNFSVNIFTDGVYGPVFEVVSGASSCPWEPGTVPFDGPQLVISPASQVDILPDQPAVFTLNIGNTSPMSMDREYHLRVINASNPDGAVVAVNGNIIENYMSFFVSAGTSVEAVMTVLRGPLAYVYEDLQLQLVSPCQYQYWADGWPMALADTVTFDVSYQVPCSESNIAVPEDNWLVTSATPADTLWVTVDGYDLSDTNLTELWLQYRRVSGAGNRSNSDSEPNFTGQPSLFSDWKMDFGSAEIRNPVLRPIYRSEEREPRTGLEIKPVAGQPETPRRRSPKPPGSPDQTLPGDNKGGSSPSPSKLTDSGQPLPSGIKTRSEDPFSRDGDWFTARVIPADSLVADYVLIPWNISPTLIIDGTYELRASARCGLGLVPGTSAIITGTIDRQPPQLLGAPTPVDGVLDPDDVISITFNENVECGAISPGAGDITLTNTVTDEAVDFTYTCGGDVITITPNVQNLFIENQILRASIGPVEDLYGNLQTSTIQWDFFVNRNPLAWSGTNIADIVIYVDETFATTRQLGNNGGSNRAWSIIGGREGALPTGESLDIPSWLTVSPMSGILTPGSAQDITIALADDLNFGEYTTTIYAAGTMGDEPLLVDIRKLCYPPAWSVNPSNYQYSMNMTATLTVDGELSDDVYDLVGVFVDDEVRGAAMLEYVPSLAGLPNTHPYEVFLTIYSNVSQGEDLSFRVWDASECTELGWVEEAYSFVANSVHGTPTSPVTITATSQIITRISYPAGWTWFSLNLENEDMSVNAALASLTPAQGDIIKSQTRYDQYVPDYGWVGTLDTLANESMYLIRVAQPDTLEMVGFAVDVELDTVPVVSGWNWIGYLPQTSLEINWALSSLDAAATGDLIKSQFRFAQFVQGLGWIGSLNYMHPKLGYNLKALNSGQLVYPFTAPPPVLARALAESGTRTLPDNYPGWNVNPSDFQYNLTLTGTMSLENVKSSDLIGAFVTDAEGEHCRGVAQPVYLEALEQYLVFLMVYGNTTAGETVEFKYYHENEDATLPVEETIEFQPNLILGTVEEPFVFTPHVLGIGDPGYVPDHYSLSQNYPNPFNPVTTFGFGLPKAGEVTITIYSLLGQPVRSLVSGHRAGGYYLVRWDSRDDAGRGVASGIYLTIMQSGSFREVKKIVLLK